MKDDKIKNEAIEFLDKYSKYLPASIKIHEQFGEDVGKLCATAKNSGIDQLEASLMEKFKIITK